MVLFPLMESFPPNTEKHVAYVGWELAEADRAMLMGFFKPQHPDVIAHHVTLKNGVPSDVELPTETSGEVIGYAKNDTVEALIVRIGGTTDRPNGGTYHVTWSIDRQAGAKPVHSNALIETGWDKIVSEIPIRLVPKVFI